MNRILLLILFIAALAACSPSGIPNITEDMSQFLAGNGFPSTGLKCSMLGNGVTPGPDAMCLLSLTPTDVAAMTNALGLQPKTDSLVTWQPSGPDCWTRLDFHDQTLSKWYISPTDDGHLQLPSGARFSYFRLFYLEDKSAACISVSYAGG